MVLPWDQLLYSQNIGFFWLPLQLIFFPTWMLWQFIYWFFDIFIPNQIQQTKDFFNWIQAQIDFMASLGAAFWIPLILMVSIVGTVYNIFIFNFVINLLIMALYLEQWKIISNSVGAVIMSIFNLVIMLLT